ncbi:MAG TPA: cysteine--tRNA ligase [Stellaceae bacterium]|nr:cysteine--tRNA ligase [Stellaceae bacterium]
MALVLYNTLTRRKDPFTPLDAANVRMYVCGPTVYDYAHIGNARPVIVFDVLYRLLRHSYGAEHVRYVRNITDIDDRIIAAAKENGEDIRALTERTVRIFHEDVAALGALPPDIEPRATEYVPEMVAMIETLIASGHAYVAEGHVLFAVASMSDYGRLSRRSRDEMIAGARVEVAPYKRDPADFVLWKPSTPEQPGWESPWGRGRPGWHLECSAMSERHLGETFDIHGGGIDLIFPHHENEIAQSVCAHNGKPFVRYWLHNAFVTVEGAKMAKSLGNFRTIRDVLAEAPGEAARYAMLMSHYRDPLDWTSDRLAEAKRALDRFYLALRSVEDVPTASAAALPPPFAAALEDDLNTPLALAALHDVLTAINKSADPVERRRLKGELLASGALLGLLQQDPQAWLKGGDGEAQRIEALIAARKAARRAKNFAEADKIRFQLATEGIVLEDKPNGTTEWRRQS